MNLFEENSNFYYIYYPYERLESFLFFDGVNDLNVNDILDKDGQLPQMYPLGYLLSKWFLFYSALIQSRNEDVINDNYINIFSKYFPNSQVLKNTLEYNASALDMFLFFVVNHDILSNDYTEDMQRLQYSSVTNIYNFINQCIGKKEYNTIDNLKKIMLANDDLKELEYKVIYPPVKRKNKSYHSHKTIESLDTDQIIDLLEKNSNQIPEYQCYKITSIKDYLYVALHVIFSSSTMIKQCKFCRRIFVPQNYQSANYCRYGVFDGQERNCYEQNKYESVMYNEKNNRCLAEEKRIRNRLHRWVEYFNGSAAEYEQRIQICEYWKQKIEEKRGFYNQKTIDEEEYYKFLTSIPKAKNLLSYDYNSNLTKNNLENTYKL